MTKTNAGTGTGHDAHRWGCGVRNARSQHPCGLLTRAASQLCQREGTRPALRSIPNEEEVALSALHLSLPTSGFSITIFALPHPPQVHIQKVVTHHPVNLDRQPLTGPRIPLCLRVEGHRQRARVMFDEGYGGSVVPCHLTRLRLCGAQRAHRHWNILAWRNGRITAEVPLILRRLRPGT